MPDVFTTLYKPDVLSCLADLSNDEVFTPPSVVNDMLDMLPQELFESPDTTFLDPVCKSGVFLREIAKRLIKGLEDTYSFAPMQDFSKPWTDAELYAKYKLSQNEIDFIESMITPME